MTFSPIFPKDVILKPNSRAIPIFSGKTITVTLNLTTQIRLSHKVAGLPTKREPSQQQRVHQDEPLISWLSWQSKYHMYYKLWQEISHLVYTPSPFFLL